jgi:hypothetical protein
VTLLRRVPREVYRVYAEDEFFALSVDPFVDTERLERTAASAAETHGRMLRRLVGPTLVLTVAGAVGGLALLADRSPSAPARHSYGREIAASGSPGRSRTARAQVWRGPARLNPSAGAAPKIRGGRHGELVRRIAALAHGTPPHAARGTLARRVLAAVRGGLAAASPESTHASVGIAAVPAAAPVQASAGPAGNPGQAEFGFERAGHQ